MSPHDVVAGDDEFADEGVALRRGVDVPLGTEPCQGADARHRGWDGAVGSVPYGPGERNVGARRLGHINEAALGGCVRLGERGIDQRFEGDDGELGQGECGSGRRVLGVHVTPENDVGIRQADEWDTWAGRGSKSGRQPRDVLGDAGHGGRHATGRVGLRRARRDVVAPD